MKPPYIPKCRKVTSKFDGPALSFNKDVIYLFSKYIIASNWILTFAGNENGLGWRILKIFYSIILLLLLLNLICN